MGDSEDRGKARCKNALWLEKQPVKVQSRSTARIDRRFMQLRAHLRACTQEQCAPNAGASLKKVLFPKSSILVFFDLVGGALALSTAPVSASHDRACSTKCASCCVCTCIGIERERQLKGTSEEVSAKAARRQHAKLVQGGSEKLRRAMRRQCAG